MAKRPAPLRRSRLAGKQASMKDVAEAAGVALITVSRALRSPDKVSSDTRRAIDEAVDRLGYVPNLIAGGLAATTTRIVSVIVPYIDHGVFADAVQGLSDTLERAGYCILLGNSGGSADREEVIIRMLLGHRPAAVVMQGANHTDGTRRLLRNARVPVVEMGTLPVDPIDMVVGYSNFDAAHLMTRHLLESGRRSIAFISLPPSQNDRAAARLAGYRAALEEAGLPFIAELVVHTTFALREGRQALGHLLAQSVAPDAVFCGSDLWAAGMVAECQRRGICVPDQLAIAGFNDQEIAAEMEPSITTIRVPRYEIGRRAGLMILNRLGGVNMGETKVDLGFEFIHRQTT
jgi:LacI family transcriptional regulator, gluconate utilization system Gnt-I transcriptional repressor